MNVIAIKWKEKEEKRFKNLNKVGRKFMKDKILFVGGTWNLNGAGVLK